MGILDFFKKQLPVTQRHGTGVLEDPRSPIERAKDYEAREVATFAPVSWTEKPSSAWRKFEIFDQDGSSSCVGNGTAKALGVENFLEEGTFVRLSARDIYTRRNNFPDGGMWFNDAMEIASNKGASLEIMLPSEKKNEAQMNDSSDRRPSHEQIALVYKAGGYVHLPFNIEEIASAISKGKAIVFGFRFNYDEWNEKPTIKTNTPTLHHCVVGVDFTLSGGEKCIVIEDSWGAATAIQGRRLITETFLRERCTYAAYFLDLSNKWRDEQGVSLPRPKGVSFRTDLKLGDQNADVKVLQDILKYEELFPVNQESTGYYGNITAKGVLAWQLRYLTDVVPAEELNALGGKNFGRMSRARANQLYQ